MVLRPVDLCQEIDCGFEAIIKIEDFWGPHEMKDEPEINFPTDDGSTPPNDPGGGKEHRFAFVAPPLIGPGKTHAAAAAHLPKMV